MEDKMKAALKTADGTFEISEVDIPKATDPDWVLARVKVAGICGTDLRHWKKAEPELVHKIMGHELAGEVVSVGENVRNLKPGDRVVIETLLGDETCDWCNIQQYNLCPHLYPIRMETLSRAFAGYIAGPSNKFYKLPDNVSYEEAALLDTFSVSLHAQKLSGLHINDKVVILGAGCIGLAQLQLAKASGADVAIIDIVEPGLEAAKDLGADLVINSSKEDITGKIQEFTSYRGADIVFECAGGSSMPETLPQAASVVRRGGKLVIVGGFDPGDTTLSLPWQAIQMGEIQLIPSASYSYWDIYPEMAICLELLSKGKINAQKMITHTFTLDQINEGFETAQDKENTHAIFVALTI